MRAIHETTIRSTWYQRRRISRRRGRQRTSIVKRTFRDALAVTDARGCWTGRDYEDDHFYPGDKNGDGAEPSSTTNLTELCNLTTRTCDSPAYEWTARLMRNNEQCPRKPRFVKIYLVYISYILY
ncbi:uncharacterized protein LOC143220128 [Lasioglossum baleicum]|uniref:uncharacterized protein LOC143220128 n=1 Tax=Lasioglossum baleicum TaxID=434251 RepID=UPI003FCDEFB2